MKYFITACVAILVFSFNGFSQEKGITHKVEKGETIAQIAQKYNVTPYDIYKLNPDAQSGLKPNSVLLIPKKGNVPAANANSRARTHKVEPKETLFGIEKKYGVSIEALKKANPELEKLGLQIGQTLVIPSSSSPKTVPSTQEKNVYHVVLPKETKYSIAKKYGITIQELERKNPEVIPNLPIGYQLTIKGTAPKMDKIVVVEPKKETPKPIVTNAIPTINYVEYVVKPRETLYSLSKISGLSQEELTKLNPDLANGVEVGMVLKMPATALIPQEVETKKEYTSLSKNTNERKKLVLLLPFNLSKVEGDTINSTAMRLKKDKFLNMTLDFYSGALMAIDSAKSIGLKVDVKIYDSQETKNESNIISINQENNLETADAIIGPFYQNNVEKTAGILGKYNVPVISPLSKDVGTAYPNLYQTIPTNEALRTAMFDFMRSKEGNIIAVVDRKKESVIQYIKENQKDVQFAALQSNGNLSTESLKSLFVKGKTNYVVMETGNTGMIKSTMAAMMGSKANYKVQLVILEPNETLDTDEINFENLTKLNLMYPSITRENKSPEALVFEKEFRKDNKIAPSTYATRGFDVTFDTMMRLSQDKSYQETADSLATEQVNNKFEYYKKEDGGFTNKGIYILYYDTDLTIKEAN
ncbi:MAG TPA: LysM peptidoglycan-binding domain-containing protein [Flavobacterium sp.]|nr:LysM peptidoglycan-binding domain-containing protein [Flavobacterium sp.]